MDLIQLARERGAAGQRVREGRGLLVEVLHQGRDLVLDEEGRLAGQQLVQDAAEGVEIGAGVHLLAEDLLGGHVARRADGHAGGGDGVRGARVVTEQLREAEVHDLREVAPRARVEQEDVAGLEVAVHDAGALGVEQGAAHLCADGRRARWGQGRLVGHELLERVPGEHLHRDEGGVRDLVHPELVDPHHVGARQAARGPRLLVEAPEVPPLGDVAVVQGLEGDHAVHAELGGEVDLPVAAGPDHALDSVTPGEGLTAQPTLLALLLPHLLHGGHVVGRAHLLSRGDSADGAEALFRWPGHGPRRPRRLLNNAGEALANAKTSDPSLRAASRRRRGRRSRRRATGTMCPARHRKRGRP